MKVFPVEAAEVQKGYNENAKQEYFNTKYYKQKTCLPQVWAVEN